MKVAVQEKEFYFETEPGHFVFTSPDEKLIISYFQSMPSTPFSGIFDSFAPSTGVEETALCTDDGLYRILNGDHRKAYEKAYSEGGFEACRDYYIQHKATSGSEWSTDDDKPADVTV